jgi:hypothetical protein
VTLEKGHFTNGALMHFFVLSPLCCMQHIVLWGCILFYLFIFLVGDILLGECCFVSLANVFSSASGLVI